MSETMKEKRKGHPPPRRPFVPVISVLLIIGLVWAVSRIATQLATTLPKGPNGGTVALVSFDIAEARDQVGMVWMGDGATQYNLINDPITQAVTESWSKLKKGTAVAEGVGWWNGPNSATVMQLHPHENLYLDAYGHSDLDMNHGFKTPPDVIKAAYSPQGTWLALLFSNRIALYKLMGTNPAFFDISRTTILIPLSTFVPHDVAINPDETTVAVVGDSPDDITSLLLYDINTAALTAQLELPQGSSMMLAFHPTKPEIAVGLDHTLYLMDTVPGATRSFPVSFEPISVIDYDDTGRWLAITGMQPETHKTAVSLYDLDSETTPEYVFTTSSMPVKGQFLKEGLVIGERGGVFTLWQWLDGNWQKTQTWPIVYKLTDPYFSFR